MSFVMDQKMPGESPVETLNLQNDKCVKWADYWVQLKIKEVEGPVLPGIVQQSDIWGCCAPSEHIKK